VAWIGNDAQQKAQRESLLPDESLPPISATRRWPDAKHLTELYDSAKVVSIVNGDVHEHVEHTHLCSARLLAGRDSISNGRHGRGGEFTGFIKPFAKT
jgi:hypothetical protein